ncbi:MAG: creatininase family protein [Bacillota bacterium]
MNSSILAHLSWPQAKQALAEGRVVVVPIGSTEQHGPHLPVGTDFMVAETIAHQVARRTKCLVTPTIPIGYAHYHTDFPGSLSVSLSTLEAYIMESLSSLIHHGATHILFVNAHGGNMPALDQVCYRLRRRGIVAATVLWWDVLGTLTPESSPAGHGDWIETSMVLSTHPGTVTMEQARMPEVSDVDVDTLTLASPHAVLFRGVPVHVRLTTADYSPTGNMPEPGLTPHGDTSIPPTAASEELGRRLIDTVVQFIVDLLDEFAKLKFH